MDIPLRGWVQSSAMKNGDSLKVLLPLSHYTRAPRMPEERKTEESLAHVMWSARSWVWAPPPTKIFLAIFCLRILAITLTKMSNAFSVLVCNYRCNVAAYNWWCLLYLNFRNIALRLAAILKKLYFWNCLITSIVSYRFLLTISFTGFEAGQLAYLSVTPCVVLTSKKACNK